MKYEDYDLWLCQHIINKEKEKKINKIIFIFYFPFSSYSRTAIPQQINTMHNNITKATLYTDKIKPLSILLATYFLIKLKAKKHKRKRREKKKTNG